jgi:uncharacterized pyridoxal phosphate-dependent enzyme
MTETPDQRRAFLKWLVALPVFGMAATQALSRRLFAANLAADASDIYQKIGVRPFINARGTWTYLSGSLELPEVTAAMQAASGQFVDMFELQRAAGKRLATLSGAESGMVTSGAAGAMAAAAAACIAGNDPARIWQLPDTTGMKHEVVMLGGRSAFDSAIRLTGAKLVPVHTVDELRPALNENTAMIYMTWRDERVSTVMSIAKAAKVPVLLDDAAGIPPIENLSRYAKLGLDLYCFSGGKGLRGPQCAGLLLGRKDLIEAALANCSPWEGSICRAMKVGKEEIMGMLAAVEAWSHIDLAALNKAWNQRVERIAKLVATVPDVTTKITIPTDGNSYPTLTVSWDESRFGFTVAQCDQELRAGEPRIEVLTNSNPSLVPSVIEGDPKSSRKERPPPNRLEIVSMTLKDGEELILGQRLREILSNARKRAGA